MMFEPVVKKSLELVSQQIEAVKKDNQHVHALVPCGGLGGSPYMWKKFEEYVADKPEIKLIQPDRPYVALEDVCGFGNRVLTGIRWSTISRGAALRGFQSSMVASRRCRRHYGISLHHQFKEGIDKEETSFICPFYGKRAPGYMNWFIAKV